MSYDNFPYTLRPIDRWPTASLTRNRKRSPFKARWTTTLRTLGHELYELKAKNVVLQIAVRDQDLRLDGRLRARAVAEHPGVILAFDSKYGPLKYAVDTYDHWQDNVRAIALALEKLRAVDRYGVTKRGEQYTGWRAIPQHTGTGFASADEAAEWIVTKIDDLPTTMAYEVSDLYAGHLEDAYRFLARHLHPDAATGSHEEFVKLQQAYQLVKEAAELALTP